jgi:hypothetical protein
MVNVSPADAVRRVAGDNDRAREDGLARPLRGLATLDKVLWTGRTSFRARG